MPDRPQDTQRPAIPEKAVEAAGEELIRFMVGDGHTCIPGLMSQPEKRAWEGAIGGAAQDAMESVLAAALPTLQEAIAERLLHADSIRLIRNHLAEVEFAFDGLPEPGDIRNAVEAAIKEAMTNG